MVAHDSHALDRQVAELHQKQQRLQQQMQEEARVSATRISEEHQLAAKLQQLKEKRERLTVETKTTDREIVAAENDLREIKAANKGHDGSAQKQRAEMSHLQTELAHAEHELSQAKIREAASASDPKIAGHH